MLKIWYFLWKSLYQKNESFYINRPNYSFVLYFCYKRRVPLQKKTKSTMKSMNVFFFWTYVTLHVKSHQFCWKRHLIIWPPPQMAIFFFFGGGGEILDLFYKFCFFPHNIKAVSSLPQVGTLGGFFDNFLTIPGTIKIFEFSKITKFRDFQANLATLFFEIEIFG